MELELPALSSGGCSFAACTSAHKAMSSLAALPSPACLPRVGIARFVVSQSATSHRSFKNFKTSFRLQMILLDRNSRWVMAGLMFAIFLLTLVVGAAPLVCKMGMASS